jgi:hypothetical protein
MGVVLASLAFPSYKEKTMQCKACIAHGHKCDPLFQKRKKIKNSNKVNPN